MPELALRFIPIGAILGDYEAGESLAIPSVVSPGGSKNMTLDRNARALSILGYTKRNAAAVTSTAGGNAMRLRHLYHHITKAGVVLTRRELAIFESNIANWELRYSPDRGTTWTLLQDFGAAYVGQIPSFAQMGTTLVLCTGIGVPQKLDMTVPSIGAAGAGQANAPLVVDAGVGLLNGTKRWKALAILADGTRVAASRSSIRQTFSQRKATITWDAVNGAASYEIYSTPGTGALFFYEGTTTAAVLTFSSNIADVDLVQNRLLQEHGDPPPTGARWATPHKQRMVYVGSPDFPRRVWLSDAGLPESVYQDANYFEMADANESDFADEAVGATGGFLGVLVIWLERSVWTLTGPLTITGAFLNAERRRTSATAGAVHGRAVAKIPLGASYIDDKGSLAKTDGVRLAYLTSFGDLRLFDGENDVIISYAKADLLRRLNYEYRRKSYVVIDTPRTEATWFFPHDNATECSAAVTWNWQQGVMTERPAWKFAHAAQIETSEDSSVLLAGESNLTTGAFCYQLWDGTTLGDGVTAVNGAVMLKTLYGRGEGNIYGQQKDEAAIMSATKRWRWIDLLVKCYVGGALGGPVTFTVECWPEEAEPTDAPYATTHVTLPTEQLYSADGSPLRTADGSLLTAPVGAPILRAKLRQVSATGKMRYLHSRGIRIRISSTTTTASWALVGANVAYQLLTGMQRQYHRPQPFPVVA